MLDQLRLVELESLATAHKESVGCRLVDDGAAGEVDDRAGHRTPLFRGGEDRRAGHLRQSGKPSQQRVPHQRLEGLLGHARVGLGGEVRALADDADPLASDLASSMIR